MGYPGYGYYGGYGYGQTGVPGQPGQPANQPGATESNAQNGGWDAAAAQAYYQSAGWGGYYGGSAGQEVGVDAESLTAPQDGSAQQGSTQAL